MSAESKKEQVATAIAGGDHPIRAWRDVLGVVTAKELSIRAGLNVGAVRDLERMNIDDVRFGTLKAIASALGIKVSDLTGVD